MECDSVEVLSPAMISQCAILNVPDVILLWPAVLETWLIQIASEFSLPVERYIIILHRYVTTPLCSVASSAHVVQTARSVSEARVNQTIHVIAFTLLIVCV